MKKVRGQAILEYLILVALVAIVCIPAMQSLGNAIQNTTVEAAREIANQ